MNYSEYTEPEHFTLYEYYHMTDFLDDSSLGDKFAINKEETIYVINSLPTYPRKYEIAKEHNRYIELLTSNQRFFIAYNNGRKNIQPKLFLTNEEDLQKHYLDVYSICTNPIPEITRFTH